MFAFQQVKPEIMLNINSMSHDYLNNEAISNGNQMGFRPILGNGMPAPALWFSPNMTYYIPVFTGMTALTSPPISPNFTASESASWNTDGWAFNYNNPVLNSHQKQLLIGSGLIKVEESIMAKEEDKSFNNEPVNQIQPEVRKTITFKEEEVKAQKKPKRKQIDKEYMPHRSQKK